MVKIIINSKQQAKGLCKLIDNGEVVGITEKIIGNSKNQLKILDKEKIKYQILDEDVVKEQLYEARKKAKKIWGIRY